MADSQIPATKLFEAQDVSWFEIHDGKRKLVLAGKLEACMTIHENETYLVLNVGSAWVKDQSVTFALKKVLPAMRSKPGVYVFPNQTGYCGLSFGGSVSEAKLAQFEKLLQNFASFEIADNVIKAESDANFKVQQGADKGVDYVKKGTDLVTDSIDTVSEAASKAIKWASQFAKKKIKKNEKETEVSDNVKWQVGKVKQMSGMAVQVSKSAVAGAVTMASQLSASLGSSIKNTKHGNKMNNAMQDPKAQAAAKVAVVTAGAAWEIYLALAKATVKFADDLADASADLVEHKYGEDAGLVARDGLKASVQGLQCLQVTQNVVKVAVAEGVLKKQLNQVQDKDDEVPAIQNQQKKPALDLD